MTVLAALVALPLAVWTLAAVFGLLDGQDLAVALRALCVRTIAIGAYVVAFGPAGQLPLLIGFAIVGLAHLGTATLARWLLVSRKRYTDATD